MAQQTATRPDTSDMVIVHRVFRREFGLAPAIVRAVPDGDAARAAVVGAHLDEMTAILHHHHTGEDELVWPRLHARADVPGDLLTRMEAQHEHVGGLLHQVGELLPGWRLSGSAAARDALAEVLTGLSAALDAHLDEEEREVLPLCREHLTAKEWAELGERGMAGVPKKRLLVVLGHILEETSPEERAGFLAHVPPPARLAYRLVGRRSWEREVATLRVGVPQQRRG